MVSLDSGSEHKRRWWWCFLSACGSTQERGGNGESFDGGGVVRLAAVEACQRVAGAARVWEVRDEVDGDKMKGEG